MDDATGNLAPEAHSPLSEWLSPATVKLRLTGTCRDSVLRELIAQVPELGDRPEAREHLFRLVRERHQEMSCAVGFGFAAPGSIEAVGLVQRPWLVLGIHFEGVAFDALDGHPVRFVVLRVAPTEEQHLALMRADSRLRRLWLQRELRSRLLGATSAEELIDVLVAADRDRAP
jgi:mannitol/fructose-specific phosphotransferase system IIA component (Ntr-type)